MELNHRREWKSPCLTACLHMYTKHVYMDEGTCGQLHMQRSEGNLGDHSWHSTFFEAGSLLFACWAGYPRQALKKLPKSPASVRHLFVAVPDYRWVSPHLPFLKLPGIWAQDAGLARQGLSATELFLHPRQFSFLIVFLHLVCQCKVSLCL